MAVAKPISSNLLQLPIGSTSPSTRFLVFTGYGLLRSRWSSSSSHQIFWLQSNGDLFPVPVKLLRRLKCLPKSTEESQWSEPETLTGDGDGAIDDDMVEPRSHNNNNSVQQQSGPTGLARIATGSSADFLSLGIREPVYEVVEVKSNGMVSTRKINRRHLLKSSGLRPRDIRSVDPSLWLTNSMPSLLVVEAALHSKIQQLEKRLMDLEPRVQALLKVLPNRLTADILEQLRISKQTLVDLGSRAGALKQMLLDILEDPHEICRICIMGKNCTLKKGNNDLECSVPLEKQIAEEEEGEIEMLLENYLQRCESFHGQAERLLDSAKEMEDSIAANLSLHSG